MLVNQTVIFWKELIMATVEIIKQVSSKYYEKLEEIADLVELCLNDAYPNEEDVFNPSSYIIPGDILMRLSQAFTQLIELNELENSRKE